MTNQHHHIEHHPDDELLVSYAAGELAEAWSLLVATHTALCPSCRNKVRAAEAIGGALVDEAAPVAMSENALALALARVERPEPQAESAATIAARSGGKPVLPQPLRDYAGSDLESLSWRRLGKGAHHIPLVSGRGAPTARLLRIPAGQPVPEHGHNGMELTMVLCGAFRDEDTLFGPGDVESVDASIEHQPVAEPGQDCICLAVTDAPLRFNSVMARMVQPFIGI